MKALVHSGRVGAEWGARDGLVTIIVDALRASATIPSLLQYGATEVMVVEHVAQALAEKVCRPEAVLVGERDCLRVEGCDLGNTPLTCTCPHLPAPVVFTSSNCSRCCVAACAAPRLFVGSAVNATAVARAAGAAAEALGTDVLLVPAGAVEDETRFNMEDHLAAGAILRCLSELFPTIRVGNDGARAAQALFGRVGFQHLPEAFTRTDHGRRLVALGLEADARWAAQRDVYDVAPTLCETRTLVDGGVGAVLTTEE
ncbi:MAG TPA: 2-phosphosulfolactate phosphatase [Armatimonadota bacterium]|jgi:2-phosphosulfolactate phosphatase